MVGGSLKPASEMAEPRVCTGGESTWSFRVHISHPGGSIFRAHMEQLPSDDSSARVRATTEGAHLSPLSFPWQETTSSFRLQTSSQGAGLRKRCIFSPAQNLLRLVSKSLGIPACISNKRECILQRHLLLCFSGVGVRGACSCGGAYTQLRGQLCEGFSLFPSFKCILGLEPTTLGLHGTYLYSTILPPENTFLEANMQTMWT